MYKIIEEHIKAFLWNLNNNNSTNTAICANSNFPKSRFKINGLP